MKAAYRLGLALVMAALALGPVAALAQDIPPVATNTTAPGAIGPRELQDFSLKGTVTQRAEPAAQQPVKAAPPPARSQAQSAPSTTPARQSSSERAGALISDQPVQTQTVAAQSAARPEPHASGAQSSATASLNSRPAPGDSSSAPPAPTPAFTMDPAPSPGTLAPEHKFPILPWLLAGIAAVAGAAFLFLRNRPRHAYAGGPQIDAFAAPEPAPQPRPAPPEAPPPPPPPAPPRAEAPTRPRSSGVVSTTLRPWMDIGFQPLRCILDEQRLTVEFEIELFNSGSGPAREVLVEARLFNAGPAQDREIASFFANPHGQGDRISVIPPLKRFARKSQVIIGREQLQAYELAGHQVAVPLIAFNALYRWSGGEGQTSVGYLIGRDSEGDKLAPFRLDLGPRLFRGLGAKPLPETVRA
ncbi:MAG TPA: hypothetical protein VFK19_12370 [Sphingomicrobium sp.]|nr:hypothetical protein [Sphingomicrobium sp.]